MATVTLYGASDDLAEIEGDFRDEFDADIYKRGRWIFNTGTQIDMYSNSQGDWVLENVTPEDVVNDDEISFSKREGHPSDMACTVTGDFTQVLWLNTVPQSARRIS